MRTVGPFTLALSMLVSTIEANEETGLPLQRKIPVQQIARAARLALRVTDHQIECALWILVNTENIEFDVKNQLFSVTDTGLTLVRTIQDQKKEHPTYEHSPN